MMDISEKINKTVRIPNITIVTKRAVKIKGFSFLIITSFQNRFNKVI